MALQTRSSPFPSFGPEIDCAIKGHSWTYAGPYAADPAYETVRCTKCCEISTRLRAEVQSDALLKVGGNLDTPVSTGEVRTRLPDTHWRDLGGDIHVNSVDAQDDLLTTIFEHIVSVGAKLNDVLLRLDAIEARLGNAETIMNEALVSRLAAVEAKLTPSFVVDTERLGDPDVLAQVIDNAPPYPVTHSRRRKHEDGIE